MITQSIERELSEFEARFVGLLKDEEAPVHLLLQYLSGQEAGRIRPRMVYLSAGLFGKIGPETHRMALVVELLHLASLIHDDVIDHAAERRGMPTTNAVFDNKIAVLLGDYLLSRVLDCIFRSGLPGVLELVTQTVSQLTRGEICQLSQRNNLDLTEEEYMRIVSMKTASLMGTAFRLGALSAGAAPEQVESCGMFGDGFGTLYQIRDDMKDYTDRQGGKGYHNDLREGDVTLPVIYTMGRLCLSDRAGFRNRYLQIRKDDGQLRSLADTVVQCGALSQTADFLRRSVKALLERCSAFPASPYRDDLERMVKEALQPETLPQLS